MYWSFVIVVVVTVVVVLVVALVFVILIWDPPESVQWIYFMDLFSSISVISK